MMKMVNLRPLQAFTRPVCFWRGLPVLRKMMLLVHSLHLSSPRLTRVQLADTNGTHAAAGAVMTRFIMFQVHQC